VNPSPQRQVGAVDLSALARLRNLSVAEMEVACGLRCIGCRRRIDHGFEWVWFSRGRAGEPQIEVHVSCADEQCPAYSHYAKTAWSRSPKVIEWLPSAPSEEGLGHARS
jgi:hypothetical protein